MNWQKGKLYKTIGGWEAMYCGVDDDGDHVFAHYFKSCEIDIRYHTSDGVSAGLGKDSTVTSEEWQEPVTHVVYLNVYGEGFSVSAWGSLEQANKIARENHLDCVKLTYVQGQSVKAEIV